MVALVEAAMEVALMEALTEIKRLRRRTCSFASEYKTPQCDERETFMLDSRGRT